MRALTGWVLAVALVAVLVTVHPTPSAADKSDEVTAEAQSDANGVTTSIGQPGRVTPSVSTSSTLDDCDFFPDLTFAEILSLTPSWLVWPAESPANPQRWTMLMCPTPVFDGRSYGYWPVGDPIPRPVVVFLGREAVARAEAPLPTPRGAPDGVSVPYVTQMPTWWWLDDDDWRTVSGTAALGQPAPASVTAVLTPTEARWQVGDAETVVCGQGTVWREGIADDDPDRCGKTFQTISGPEGVEQTVSVSFAISFVCNPTALCGQLPTFDPVVVSSTTTVEVIQVRGVLVS